MGWMFGEYIEMFCRKTDSVVIQNEVREYALSTLLTFVVHKFGNGNVIS